MHVTFRFSFSSFYGEILQKRREFENKFYLWYCLYHLSCKIARVSKSCYVFNPIHGGYLRGCLRMGGPKRSLFPKILHAHPVTMKLGTVIPYLKKIRKHHESRETPLRFCWHQHFFIRTQQLLLCHFNTKFIILFFFEFWRVVLINLVAILMTSAKFATLGLLRIRLFWNKGYDVHDC